MNGEISFLQLWGLRMKGTKKVPTQVPTDARMRSMTPLSQHTFDSEAASASISVVVAAVM